MENSWATIHSSDHKIETSLEGIECDEDVILVTRSIQSSMVFSIILAKKIDDENGIPVEEKWKT